MRAWKLFAIAVAMTAVAAGSPAGAHTLPGSLTGTTVTNVMGDVLTINATFVAGVGTGTLTLNGTPLAILCMKVLDNGGTWHEFFLNAGVRNPAGGGTPTVFMRIINDHPFYGDVFGQGSAIPVPSPCNADVNVYPLVGSANFTVV